MAEDALAARVDAVFALGRMSGVYDGARRSEA
jgi:hypothetical protein